MDVPPLDDDAMTAAYRGSARLGKLDGLAVWLAGVQGAAPPKPLAHRRFVVFGDEVPHPVATLADALDVATTVVGYDAPAPIATEPATTRGRAQAAYDAGRALAGTEADKGTDVLLMTCLAAPVLGAAIACALVDAEPVDTVSRQPDSTDAMWMGDVATVRDALRRSGFRGLDAMGLLAELGGETVAAAAGFVAGAAARRTPLVVDGAVALAAVAVANACAPSSVAYVLVAHRSPDPAHAVLREALGLDPLLDLGITVDGPAALLALPLLDAAVALSRPAFPEDHHA